jgi:hypothetical protein
MTRDDHRPTARDRYDVVARAREAQHRAELVTNRAWETAIEAMITRIRIELVPLSPVVEARLHLLLGRPPTEGSEGRAPGREPPPDHPAPVTESAPGSSGREAVSGLNREILQQRLVRPRPPHA